MRRLFTPLLALGALSACATITTPRNCERALSGLETAQQIVAVLQARGVAQEIAAKIASALLVGQVSVGVACSSAG